MEWTTERVAAAVVGVTALVNLGIVSWLFGDDPTLLAVGVAVVVVGSAGGYRSLRRALSDELPLDD